MQTVRNADGTEADENICNAILLSYSELGRIGRSDTASGLAAGLDASDLEKLAVQVYDLWFAAGAQAKQKWVLPFAAVFGGAAVTARLSKAIHDWPEHQRGAIACDAVMALALSSDPAAIVIVDAISRKFRFRQVKVAAAEALENAAKELGIGAELRFSGSAVGYDDGEDVTVFDAVFYTGTVNRGSYVYDTVPAEQIVPLGAVPARYYGEIVHQLTRATASSTDTNENWRTEKHE